MSIPLYDGRKARFRLELVPQGQVDEEDLVLAALSELDEEHAVSKKVCHRMITCTRFIVCESPDLPPDPLQPVRHHTAARKPLSSDRGRKRRCTGTSARWLLLVPPRTFLSSAIPLRGRVLSERANLSRLRDSWSMPGYNDPSRLPEKFSYDVYIAAGSACPTERYSLGWQLYILCSFSGCSTCNSVR